MSAGEIGEIMGALEECYVLIGKLELKMQTLKTETAHAVGGLREAEYIFYRLSSLLTRIGLPPDMQKAVQVAQHLLLTIRMLHSAIILMEASTPYGWLLAGISIATTGVMAVTTGEMIVDSTMGR